jgi:hypothetical protein
LFSTWCATSNFTESGRLPDFVETSGRTAERRQVS